MHLEEQLLGDYGSIPQKVGMFLLKHNCSSFLTIKESIDLSEAEARDGLIVLIQRRFVNFFIFEKSIRYNIDSEFIKRRLYFPIYMKFVIDNFSSKHAKHFSQILINGIFKETEPNELTDDLINSNILQIDSTRNTKSQKNISYSALDDDRGEIKIRKLNSRYILVNYHYLDQKIYESELVKYVSKRYNECTGEILKAILKCDRIDRSQILKTLENTKILLLDNGTLINEQENINEYLKYLCYGQIIQRSMNDNRGFIVNSCLRLLKLYRINLMIKDEEARRIFNMIASKTSVEDKDLTMHSLLSVNKVKRSLFELQKNGLISQKCNGDYKGNSRIEHSWMFDSEFACRSIIKKLQEHLIEKLKNYNQSWDVNYYMGEAQGNESVWISDIINLSTDHLIFSMK